MKTIPAITMAGLLACGLTASVSAQEPKSIFEQAAAATKQTADDFKPAADQTETRFGNLEFPGGYPTEETTQKVYDELDLQRATQLYLDMYPALSMRGMMIGTARDYGAKDSSHVSVTADRLDSKAMWLTGNTESIYAMIVFDLKVDGPTVFQAPAGLWAPWMTPTFCLLLILAPQAWTKARAANT